MNTIFRALADPTRREILARLRKGPLTSGQIAEFFPSAWPTISRHLSVLREAGLITAHRNGQFIQYELDASVLQDVIQHLMTWVEKGGRRRAP